MAKVLAVTFAMSQSIEDLTAILSETPELTVTEPEIGFPVIEVQTPVSAATIAVHGAQVLTWAPTDHPPVLYVSPKAKMTGGESSPRWYSDMLAVVWKSP